MSLTAVEMPTKRQRKIDKAISFSADLESNEEDMGEMAAFCVTCEQFGISQEEGWSLLRLLSESHDS